MTSNLSVTKVGVYKLVVERVPYVCSAFSLTMSINQIPTASCVVGCGRTLLGSSRFDNNAEDLYKEIQNIEMSNSAELIPCEVYEDLDDVDYLVFKGSIVGASLVYKTGSATIRAVRFEMMYNACNLMAQPLTAYKNICGSQIVKMLLSGKMLTDQEAAEKQGMARMGQLASMLIVGKLEDMIKEKDLATRIACLCDAFVVLNSYTYNLVNPQTAGVGSLLKIKDYIRSSYSLDKKKLDLANTITDNSFNVELCDALTQVLQSGSIYDAITRAILSPEFLLSIIPRFSDGMMEIKPSSAWGTNDSVYQLPLSSVASMNSAFHPLDHINDPEVFAVNFSDALDMRGNAGQTAGVPAYLIGAYASDPVAAEYVKKRLSQSDPATAAMNEVMQDTKHYKWKLYRAPKWLHNSFTRTRQTSNPSGAETKPADKDEVVQANAIEDQKSKDKLGEATDSAPKRQPDQQDYLVGENIADSIAQAIYTMLYRQTATAELDLLPDIRFGINKDKYGFVLEDLIGEPIDIVPVTTSDAAGLDNTPLKIRGMVHSIAFSYNAGQSASCSYRMTLSRVRPFDAKEEKITCPLYAKITENKQA